MYTVYIKLKEDEEDPYYINVDHIVRIEHVSGNRGHIHTTQGFSTNYNFYINEPGEKKVDKLLSMINEAKIESEESRKPIILDLSKGRQLLEY
jgi:hypothetical protein